MAYASNNADYTAESRTVTPQTHSASVQAWKKTTATRVEAALEGAVESRTAAGDVNAHRPFHKELANNANPPPDTRTFESALAQSSTAAPTGPDPSDFSFDDVIDVINPLHHLPIIGTLYRELTGDHIGPMAQIVGGGIYGGPLGAVSGTINAVVQESTGKDIGGNVMALVIGDDGVATPTAVAGPASIDRDNPEMALSLASAQYTGEQYVPVAVATAPTMPDTAMGFAARKAAQAYEKAAVADGRTAGWRPQIIDAPAIDVDYSPAQISVNNLPPREAMTVLPLDSRPVFGGLY